MAKHQDMVQACWPRYSSTVQDCALKLKALNSSPKLTQDLAIIIRQKWSGRLILEPYCLQFFFFLFLCRCVNVYSCQFKVIMLMMKGAWGHKSVCYNKYVRELLDCYLFVYLLGWFISWLSAHKWFHFSSIMAEIHNHTFKKCWQILDLPAYHSLIQKNGNQTGGTGNWKNELC